MNKREGDVYNMCIPQDFLECTIDVVIFIGKVVSLQTETLLKAGVCLRYFPENNLNFSE